MAGGKVSATYSEILALILIAVNLFFSILLHRLEQWAAAKHIYLQTVMRLMYRELMLLGLVSFTFLAVELSWKPLPTNLLESFEFVHTLIFALAIFYALTVIFSNYTSVRLSSRWQAFEDTSLEDYLKIKADYVDLETKFNQHHNNPFFRLRHWNRFHSLHDAVVFHDLRFQFVFFRHLPEDFHFTSYLRKVKATVYTHLVDIHWSLWAAAFIFEAGDLVRRYLVEKVDPALNPTFDGALIVALAIFTIGLCFLLERKIKDVYRTLTANPATYYNDFDPVESATESSFSDRATSVSSLSQPERDSSFSVGDPGDSSGDDQLSYIEEPEFPVNNDFTDTTNPSQKRGLGKLLFRRIPKRPTARKPPAAVDQLDEIEQGVNAEFHADLQPSPSTEMEPNPGAQSSLPDFLLETDQHARDDLEILSQSRNERSSIGEISNDGHGDHAHAISFNLPYRHPGIGLTTLISNPAPPQSELSIRQSTDSDRSQSVRSFIPRQELERQREREISVSSRGDVSRPRASASRAEGERASLALHQQNVREAAQRPPATKFPRLILLVVPRLKRVAAPVEKLFWFGSHRFFLWLVQLSLFLGTLLPSIMVATAAVSASDFDAVHWTAFGISAAALAFTLLRSAQVLKTYTYVINASSLVSEELVAEVVTRVVDKKAQRFREEVASMSVASSQERGSQRSSRRQRKRNRVGGAM